MKGIIFNLLEELVVEHYGDQTWDGLLEAAGMDGAFTSLGNYPDEDLVSLVRAASSATGTPPEEVLRWFGRNAIAKLAERYPMFFEEHESTRSFLLTLNSIIHPEVRKIYPGADVPVFGFDASSPDVLVVEYLSARKLCAVAEGLIEGSALHFGETLSIDHRSCMNRGADRCVLACSFAPIPIEHSAA